MPASLLPRLLLLTTLHFASIAVMLLSGRWLREMGGSESVLGWFSASIVPGIVLGAPLAGRLAARCSERSLIIVGLLLVAGSALAFAQFSAISWWLCPLRMLQGVGHGVVFTSLFSLAAHHVPDNRKAQGIGYVALAAQLGNVGGVSLAEGLILHAAGFPAAFAGAAALGLLGLLTACTLPGEISAHSTTAGKAQGAAPQTWQIALCIAFFSILGGSYGSVLQLVPLLVQDIAARSGGSAAATPVLTTIFLTVAVCRLFLAGLADGRHRRPVLIAVTLLLMAATVAWPHAHSQATLMVVAVFFALGYGLLFPGLNGLVLGHLSSAWRSRASGWIVMAYDGGFFGWLLILGPIAEYFGYVAMFQVLLLLQILSGLAFWAMTRR